MLGHLFLAGPPGIAPLQHTSSVQERRGVVAKTQELGVRVGMPRSGQGGFRTIPSPLWLCLRWREYSLIYQPLRLGVDRIAHVGCAAVLPGTVPEVRLSARKRTTGRPWCSSETLAFLPHQRGSVAEH